MLRAPVSDGIQAIGINKMEIAIILTDVVIKIILLALIIFSGAVLAAIIAILQNFLLVIAIIVQMCSML